VTALEEPRRSTERQLWALIRHAPPPAGAVCLLSEAQCGKADDDLEQQKNSLRLLAANLRRLPQAQHGPAQASRLPRRLQCQP
jgi:hypothetical protein